MICILFFKYFETWLWLLWKCLATDSWELLGCSIILRVSAWNVEEYWWRFFPACCFAVQALASLPTTSSTTSDRTLSFQLKQNQLVPFWQPWQTVKEEFHYSRGCCYGRLNREYLVTPKRLITVGAFDLFFFQFLQFLEYQQILLYFNVWFFL